MNLRKCRFMSSGLQREEPIVRFMQGKWERLFWDDTLVLDVLRPILIKRTAVQNLSGWDELSRKGLVSRA